MMCLKELGLKFKQFWIVNPMLKYLLRKDADVMAIIYATLIVKGKKTFTEVPEYIIKMMTDEGDLVCDPFIGSGTTGRIAELLQRRWIGFEINDAYR
ncbi:site-specific DNA-methyltransferase [candidate division WWE3 bacterium]|uniref:Site-specific DNA-methyltransferase n=1 Tax=candidate division WWE3 bacterium TaxID=2053526 RepID=A0A7X9DKK8_UNCKA|nr:site-specific DNA-methyltransferase [candidate division WWE3 bacterium]